MKEQHSNPSTRWAQRSLPQQLLHKFLHEYGYEQGAVVAQAIVEDILQLVNQLYSDALPPRHIYWPAVPHDNGRRGKSPQIEKLVNIQLQMVTDEEVAMLHDHKLCGIRRARYTFNQHRFVRWCRQAYDQGGVLTLLDLSLLSGMSESRASALIREYEKEHHTTVPIRGTVHDIGRSVTHKAEVIRRLLKGQSPADIASELRHSQRAVDAYIKDYETTRKLVPKFSLREVASISRRAYSVVKEHVRLIREYEPGILFYPADDS